MIMFWGYIILIALGLAALWALKPLVMALAPLCAMVICLTRKDWRGALMCLANVLLMLFATVLSFVIILEVIWCFLPKN